MGKTRNQSWEEGSRGCEEKGGGKVKTVPHQPGQGKDRGERRTREEVCGVNHGERGRTERGDRTEKSCCNCRGKYLLREELELQGGQIKMGDDIMIAFNF